MTEVFGKVVYKMSVLGIHLKYRKELIDYFKEICSHKQESIRKQAVFHLPCMNLLFKQYEKELEISFQDVYLKFSEDEEFEIRRCAAASLHEAFVITEDEEDISKLRQCFISYILDNNRDILLLLNKNLATIIKKYGNSHTIKTFKGRTAYIEQSNSDSGSNKETSPNSKTNKSANNNNDFTMAVETHHQNKS